MKYRKKPVVIDAIQFKIEDPSTKWEVCFGTPDPEGQPYLVDKYWIPTLEGWHEVTDGDYIITGVKGEKYPCKPDIFAMTYEAVLE